jgi:XrtN system VIT domain protein
MSFFIAIALIFNVYQAFMIFPASPFGIAGTPFFGISLLLFVPIFYVICLISLLRRLTWNTGHKVAFFAGIVVTILVVAIFTIEFKIAENRIIEARLNQDAPFEQDYDLPDWISIAQVLKNTPLTEKYLKLGLVYQGFANYDKDGISSIWRSSFDEKYIHDPLIAFASIFTKQKELDEMTKIKVLNYLYDARHQTSDRFWSGDNLKCKQIVTNIELFPEDRLSFTEHIITIQNDIHSKSRWRNQQEALFTFELPEGGVVTSLSLWIEGQEEKAILTSKKKAQNAYNSIVGKERRDPSVVYWMEGNKIRVRVFPCTPEEDRKFKVGITSPLNLDNEHLIYQSIGFKGPDFAKATSAVHVVTHDADIIKSSINFKDEAMYKTWKGNYRADWNLAIEKTNVSEGSFSFQKEYFRVENTINLEKEFIPKRIYLDVSSKWTIPELNSITKMLEGKEVIAFTTHYKKMNAPNSIVRLGESSLPTFTLFPFHKSNLDQALIITKGESATPNLSDLQDTEFKNLLFDHFKNQKVAPLVIDIGQSPTDYMKSLKEFNVINYHALSLNQLLSCFEKNHFPTVNNDPDITVIPQNGLSIRRTHIAPENGTKSSDHLMRLFYYQEVMNEIGNKFFTDDKNEYIEDQIVDKAALANIVTPLSSLIVLETQQDYERFDIKKKTDSLGNASINNAGAVPEPHEWAMIFIGIGFLFILYRRSKKQLATT